MSDYWREQLIRNLRIPADRIKALPFGFDTSISPSQSDGAEIRRQFGIDGRSVIFYLGSIGPPRDVSILADIMVLVVKKVPEACLMILPIEKNQRFVSRLKEAFIKRGIEQNVVFAPSVPHEQVFQYIAAANIGLSPIEPIPVYNVSSPAKFVEMLGMGCPVVASDTPEQKTIIERWKAGICVPYNAHAFAEAILYLLYNPKEGKRLSQQGRLFVEKERSFSLLADYVEEIYLVLAANHL
jgi:glycosyltransferase involved in cell wall biosynthesis